MERFEVGQAVEPSASAPGESQLRGVIERVQRVDAPWGVEVLVRWIGRDRPWWYQPRELRATQQDDHGNWVIPVALF